MVRPVFTTFADNIYVIHHKNNNVMKRSILFLFLLATICVSAQNTPSDADAKYAIDLIKPGVSIPDFKLRDSNDK